MPTGFILEVETDLDEDIGMWDFRLDDDFDDYDDEDF